MWKDIRIVKIFMKIIENNTMKVVKKSLESRDFQRILVIFWVIFTIFLLISVTIGNFNKIF